MWRWKIVEVDAYYIEAGTLVATSFPYTHRLTQYWDNPEAFITERFNDETEEWIPRYAYLPFGAEPHACIGNTFAMMEVQLMLATIAQSYQLHLSTGQVVEMVAHITLYPKNRLPMQIQQHESVRIPQQA